MEKKKKKQTYKSEKTKTGFFFISGTAASRVQSWGFFPKFQVSPLSTLHFPVLVPFSRKLSLLMVTRSLPLAPIPHPIQPVILPVERKESTFMPVAQEEFPPNEL